MDDDLKLDLVEEEDENNPVENEAPDISDLEMDEEIEDSEKEKALKRKKEILSILNKYNEDMLDEGASDMAEATILDLEEEYAILEDAYPEKAESEAQESWVSRVSWWIILYPILVTFLTMPALVKIVGLEINEIIKTLIPNMPALSGLWFYLAVILFLYPIVMVVITWTIHGFIRKSENKRFFKWVFLYHILYFIGTTLFLFFDLYLPIVR